MEKEGWSERGLVSLSLSRTDALSTLSLLSLHTCGSTHSFLDQTPDPYGQTVRPVRASNRAFQYSGP